MAWRPDTYLAFADHRTRPAYELVARIPLDAPETIFDLGCGPGNSTRALAERWPAASVTGVDNSEEMLTAARRDGPKQARWESADVEHWSPVSAADLIFSNATLQWIGGQEHLLPRLCSQVRPGGAFAFQVPANHSAPPHTIIDEALAELGLSSRVEPASLSRHVHPQADYYQILRPQTASLDIWDTEYLQVLRGDDAVFNWVKGTALVPIMAALGGNEAKAFEERLKPKLRAHYPKEPGGETLFPFRRRFVVAIRS